MSIHHVTALATDPQTNLDFYAGILGLRLVKRTVNFDDPGTYHFYYGNETGQPGTILTFFPWPGARRGVLGTGQTTEVSFSVPEASLGYWVARLRARGITLEEPESRLDETAVSFLDPDGLRLALVAHARAEKLDPWDGGGVPAEHAIRGFHGVTLRERRAEGTALLLTEAMGFRAAGETGTRLRFESVLGDVSTPGTRVDLVLDPEGYPGRIAAGSVHHVAFRAADDAAHLALRAELIGHGLHVTPVRDRTYFHSIYFREPGGVLFEIATEPPGFTLDETVAELGSALRLPGWLEASRGRIEAVLPPITIPGEVSAEPPQGLGGDPRDSRAPQLGEARIGNLRETAPRS